MFLLGAIAKLGATVVTYPLLVVKVHEVAELVEFLEEIPLDNCTWSDAIIIFHKKIP